MAFTYNNMAVVYDNQGEYDKALKYYEKDLVISLKKLGNDHPDVASTYNNMAVVYDNQGNYDKALEYYEMALDIQLMKLGNDNPDVADTKYNIALLYKNKLDNKVEAKKLFEDCVRIYTTAYGEDHTETIDAKKKSKVVFKYIQIL